LLREYNILLLSINIAHHRSKEDIESIKEKYGLKREVITNPISEAENSYQIQVGGVLIVLAQYEQVVLDVMNALEEK
jgi:hypothetical protein